MLDRRAARDPQRRAQLGGDDHRQGGLAEAGRAGQQHVVGRPAAPPGRLEHQAELLAHPVLADELVQACAGRSAASTARRPRPRSVQVDQARAVSRTTGSRRAHAPVPGRAAAARSSVGDVGGRVAGVGARRLDGRRRPREPTSRAPTRRGVQLVAPGRRPAAAALAGCGAAPCRRAPSRSLSSSTIRCAPLRPMPGTWVSAARSSVATARRSASGACTASMACASRGPTPLAVCSDLEDGPLVVVGEAEQRQRVLADDQATSAAGPARRAAARRASRGVHGPARPTPPTSTTAASRRRARRPGR